MPCGKIQDAPSDFARNCLVAVVAAMVLIVLMGLALDLGVRRLEKLRSVRWGFSE